MSDYPWYVRDQIEAAVGRKADKHEIFTIHSNVGSVEHSVRELRACIDGLRATCEALLSRI